MVTMKVSFLKDLGTDLIGGSGYTIIMSMPLLDEISGWIKLFASIGGLVLVYFSIKLKIELLKQKKIENDERKKLNSKSDR